MFVLKLLLKTTSYDIHVLNKRFRLMEVCHNILVKRGIKLLSKLKRDKRYQALLKEYIKISKSLDLLLKSKSPKSKENKALIKELSIQKKDIPKELSTIRESIGLSKSGLEKYISLWQGKYKNHLSSFQCQKEAERVYKGIEKVLYGNGKKLRYKKRDSQHTICGKDTSNGIKVDLSLLEVSYLGLSIKCKRPNINDVFKMAALSLINLDGSNISYYEISREPFKNGFHYYLDIYIKENAPIRHPFGESISGMDPGTSTIAFVSDNKAILDNLAPLSKTYDDKIKVISRKMDASKRLSNPDNFNPDGTIKKGKKKWRFSNTYKKLRWQLKDLYRRKAAYIKQSHEELANTLIEESIYAYTEDMNYKALQKRSSKTEREDKTTAITQKDGSVKQIHKYKKKKRFGKSIGNKSPAMFLNIFERKAVNAGGFLIRIPPGALKASQYDHSTDTCTKTDLSVRNKTVNGEEVQRDLYSSFLIKNVDSSLKSIDRQKCIDSFDRFIVLQNERIEYMKANNISNKACFGF